MVGRAAIVVVALFVSLLAGGVVRPAAYYTAVLDELSIPAEWDFVLQEVHAPGGDVDCGVHVMSACPFTIRYYRAAPPPAGAYHASRLMADAAGFSIEREYDRSCDGGATGVACSLLAERDDHRIQVNVYGPGQADRPGLAVPDRVLIRVTAQR